jgi:hypothetical protein
VSYGCAIRHVQSLSPACRSYTPSPMHCVAFRKLILFSSPIRCAWGVSSTFRLCSSCSSSICSLHSFCSGSPIGQQPANRCGSPIWHRHCSTGGSHLKPGGRAVRTPRPKLSFTRTTLSDSSSDPNPTLTNEGSRLRSIWRAGNCLPERDFQGRTSRTSLNYSRYLSYSSKKSRADSSMNSCLRFKRSVSFWTMLL